MYQKLLAIIFFFKVCSIYFHLKLFLIIFKNASKLCFCFRVFEKDYDNTKTLKTIFSLFTCKITLAYSITMLLHALPPITRSNYLNSVQTHLT